MCIIFNVINHHFIYYVQILECNDTDNGVKDTTGDGCEIYTQRPEYCGLYETNEFQSNMMCCACGGGNRQGK